MGGPVPGRYSAMVGTAQYSVLNHPVYGASLAEPLRANLCDRRRRWRWAAAVTATTVFGMRRRLTSACSSPTTSTFGPRWRSISRLQRLCAPLGTAQSRKDRSEWLRTGRTVRSGTSGPEPTATSIRVRTRAGTPPPPPLLPLAVFATHCVLTTSHRSLLCFRPTAPFPFG